MLNKMYACLVVVSVVSLICPDLVLGEDDSAAAKKPFKPIPAEVQGWVKMNPTFKGAALIVPKTKTEDFGGGVLNPKDPDMNGIDCFRKCKEQQIKYQKEERDTDCQGFNFGGKDLNTAGKCQLISPFVGEKEDLKPFLVTGKKANGMKFFEMECPPDKKGQPQKWSSGMCMSTSDY